MYFLRYTAVPASDAQPIEALICCWVERPTLAEAEAFVLQELDGEWDVVEREVGEPVTADAYDPEDDHLAYYHQALTDGEVIVVYTAPRHPVYWVTATVEQEGEPNKSEAHYMISAESIAREGEDVFAPDFWSGKMVELAEQAAKEFIGEAGYQVVAMTASRPCGRRDVPEDMQDFYDEAEESGSCLVFVHES